MTYAFPTIIELTVAVTAEIEATDFEALEAEYPNDEDQQTVDIRLQVTGGGWTLHTGDASYDTDHNGVWGASFLGADSVAADVAAELLDDAEEMAAQGE